MITFNDVAPPQQPNIVNENPVRVKTDRYAIDGTPSRTQMASKNQAKLIFMAATPETFQFFKDLYDSATSVTYKNTDSNVSGGVLEFTGIIDYNEDEFIRGGSLRVPLEVTVLEGSTYKV